MPHFLLLKQPFCSLIQQYNSHNNIKGEKQPRNIPKLFSTVKDSDHLQTNFYNKNEETYCVSKRIKL